MASSLSLDLVALSAAYSVGLSPIQLVRQVYSRISDRGDDHVWISRRDESEVTAEAADLELRRAAGEKLPLYGVPFAVKDNFDVAGMPTTAACPAYAYTPSKDAAVVARLRAAGALLIGKTNMDQFATGLVGTRSPYGTPSSVFHKDFISGGSSSGSAVAVAAGLVSFALGTDTAGSGRVPAAFNNLVGWKPTRGLLSTSGLLPACRSLDCASVFTLNCADAATIAKVAIAFDAADSFSRLSPSVPPALPACPRFGVPRADQLEFFGDDDAARLYGEAVDRLRNLGATQVEIDLQPFREVAELLYSGPWAAERLAALTPFIDEHPDALHPVTSKIIDGARRFTAVDTFRGFYRLEVLRRTTAAEWNRMDVLLLPTTPTIYRHCDINAEPVLLNSRLGTYTNFVNLLDLCGIAVPAGFRADGLPQGVTLLAQAFTDWSLFHLAARLHGALGGRLGGTSTQLDTTAMPEAPRPSDVMLAVMAAHLSGQPLNYELTDLGARLLYTSRTANNYRLYVIPDTTVAKAGLIRDDNATGPGVELEIWTLSVAAFGAFTARVASPHAIGNVTLADGSLVKGFLCEPAALIGAEDITSFGGWRNYLASRRRAPEWSNETSG